MVIPHRTISPALFRACALNAVMGDGFSCAFFCARALDWLATYRAYSCRSKTCAATTILRV